MPSASARFIAAVVQASPVVFDQVATLARVKAGTKVSVSAIG